MISLVALIVFSLIVVSVDLKIKNFKLNRKLMLLTEKYSKSLYDQEMQLNVLRDVKAQFPYEVKLSIDKIKKEEQKNEEE